MADITWITINGAHIPINKGESRTRAVARFFKERKGKKATVKKYSTDPYNRVEKAREAKAKAEKEYTKEVKRTNKEYEDLKTGTQYQEHHKDMDELWEKYSNAKSTKSKLFYWSKIGQEEARYDKKIAYARRNSDEAENDSKINSALAMQYEAIKDYKYKLKTDKSNTPTKKTIKGYGKTDRMKKADKDYERQYNKAEQRVRDALHTPAPSYVHDADWGKFQKATKTAKTKKTKAYTYRRKK